MILPNKIKISYKNRKLNGIIMYNIKEGTIICIEIKYFKIMINNFIFIILID